jgi:hypothetical protein
MPNDLVPTEPEAPHWLQKLNIPEIIAGPAGKALSRLIAGVADIPAAYLEQVSQGIRDKTEAKTAMVRAVAEAATKQAIADPELIRRAANAFLAKELRAQSNKEQIARKTVELLQEEAPPGQPDAASEGPDDDWLNVFERYAEEASTERLQSIWARVLSRQIRRPRSFSLRTLRFVAELDAEVAALFEKYAPRVVNTRFIPIYGDADLNELLQLEDVGLLTGAAGTLMTSIQLSVGERLLRYREHGLFLEVTEPAKPTVGCTMLTQIGREIYQLATAPDDIEHARVLAQAIPKQGIARIEYVDLRQPARDPRVEIWRTPVP